MQNKNHIIVIGAGIAGLSTAYLLHELGRERHVEVDITILEANERYGGVTRTVFHEGYTCEWGPNGFLDNEPATLKLIDRLGLSGDLIAANQKASARFIYHNGKMRQLPANPQKFLSSDILPFYSKLRMACELFIPAKRNGSEETVSSFGKRRLGSNFTRYILDPIISGIFAGDIDKLSLRAIFPKMVEMETNYGGLFKALIAKKRDAKRQQTASGGRAGHHATLHTFRRGMGQLTDALAEQLQDNILLSHSVEAIGRSNDRFEVICPQRSFRADAVVLACPSHAAADIIADFSPDVSTALKDIYHAPVSVVCHGHEVAKPADRFDGFGVLIPRIEGIRSLGTLWSDSIFSGQAPEGYQLLRTIIGGAHDREIEHLSDAELNGIAEHDHHQVMGIIKQPTYRQIFRHPQGIAQYNIGHLRRVKSCEDLESQQHGLYFTGASYRGVSVNDCVKDAFRVAENYWRERN